MGENDEEDLPALDWDPFYPDLQDKQPRVFQPPFTVTYSEGNQVLTPGTQTSNESFKTCDQRSFQDDTSIYGKDDDATLPELQIDICLGPMLTPDGPYSLTSVASKAIPSGPKISCLITPAFGKAEIEKVTLGADDSSGDEKIIRPLASSLQSASSQDYTTPQGPSGINLLNIKSEELTSQTTSSYGETTTEGDTLSPDYTQVPALHTYDKDVLDGVQDGLQHRRSSIPLEGILEEAAQGSAKSKKPFLSATQVFSRRRNPARMGNGSKVAGFKCVYSSSTITSHSNPNIPPTTSAGESRKNVNNHNPQNGQPNLQTDNKD